MKQPKSHYQEMPNLRQQAIALAQLGEGPKAVSEKLRVARSTEWRWRKLNEQQNDVALAKPMGRPRRLTEAQRTAITEALLLGPEANGFDSQLWNLKRIAELIERLTAVTYHPNYLSDLLHTLGWTCQKPEGRARERNEEAIERWVHVDWPNIKKKPKI
jgi:transposase